MIGSEITNRILWEVGLSSWRRWEQPIACLEHFCARKTPTSSFEVILFFLHSGLLLHTSAIVMLCP